MDRGISLLVEHDLSHAAAIANIDKNQVAKIAPPVYPSHEHGLFARISRTQSAAHVCTSVDRLENRASCALQKLGYAALAGLL